MGKSPLRAIDLYSGVGGWSRGLSMAGIEVVASYEKWEAANRTNRINNGHVTHTVDIRALPLTALPNAVDLVVGSPPCTEFSYSNRGGAGDLDDGLQDIIKFLEIVDYLKPRWWVMENVPRTAAIVERELRPDGRLAPFRHLKAAFAQIDMEEFGLPQRRKRCLIGNIDFALLQEYRTQPPGLTLGDVTAALSGPVVHDPLFGISMESAALIDHEPEPVLDAEESRINRAGKLTHPVYNSMSFPDPYERSSRTITATCTRVSRESVVIEDRAAGGFRRLTIRERACLQGFPITYQFYGVSHGAKVRMIGNAVPPAFAYYVGHSIRNTKPLLVPLIRSKTELLSGPRELPPMTRPDKRARRFPANRNFRFAIPSLRLKSGVRFELTNAVKSDKMVWRVDFYFGSSKDIHSISLDPDLRSYLLSAIHVVPSASIKSELKSLESTLQSSDLSDLQGVWNNHGGGKIGPFEILDHLSASGQYIMTTLESANAQSSGLAVKMALARQYGGDYSELPGIRKLLRNADLICAGLILGSAANELFEDVDITLESKSSTARRVIALSKPALLPETLL